MDELLESQIKFKEELLRQYQRLSTISKANGKRYEKTIDRMLDELQELYKQRKQ